MDDIFPSRKEILDSKKSQGYQDTLVEEIKSIDVEKIDFSKGDFKPRTKIAEKQKVFFWIRVYLNNEDKSCKPDDVIKIKHIPSGEILETKFICYSKKGVDKDSQDEIVNYSTEDDKKVLCLMVDSDRINTDSKDIPFIRSLFRTSKFFEFNLVKRDELLFVNAKGKEFEYYDVSF